MEINIYYLLGGLAILYIAISVYNKRGTKKRRSRKFMEGYERKDKRDEKNEDSSNSV